MRKKIKIWVMLIICIILGITMSIIYANNTNYIDIWDGESSYSYDMISGGKKLNFYLGEENKEENADNSTYLQKNGIYCADRNSNTKTGFTDYYQSGFYYREKGNYVEVNGKNALSAYELSEDQINALKYVVAHEDQAIIKDVVHNSAKRKSTNIAVWIILNAGTSSDYTDDDKGTFGNLIKTDVREKLFPNCKFNDDGSCSVGTSELHNCINYSAFYEGFDMYMNAYYYATERCKINHKADEEITQIIRKDGIYLKYNMNNGENYKIKLCKNGETTEYNYKINIYETNENNTKGSLLKSIENGEEAKWENNWGDKIIVEYDEKYYDGWAVKMECKWTDKDNETHTGQPLMLSYGYEKRDDTTIEKVHSDVSLQKYVHLVNDEASDELKLDNFARKNMQLRRKANDEDGYDKTLTANPSKSNSTVTDEPIIKEENPVIINTGDTVTYRITVYNNSDVNAENVILRDAPFDGRNF